jgi:hypothetical protein
MRRQLIEEDEVPGSSFFVLPSFYTMPPHEFRRWMEGGAR